MRHDIRCEGAGVIADVLLPKQVPHGALRAPSTQLLSSRIAIHPCFLQNVSWVYMLTVALGGMPMLSHSTVTFSDGYVGSLALWRLNMATAREPLYRGAAYTWRASALRPLSTSQQQRREEPAFVCTASRAGADLNGSLLPDKLASNAQRVLVDRNHLRRCQDVQRSLGHVPVAGIMISKILRR